jgi:hypothetical protein
MILKRKKSVKKFKKRREGSMPSKKSLCTSLFVLLSIMSRLFAPIPEDQIGQDGRPLQEIYKKSLAAIRNIVDVKSELKDKIDTIEEEKVTLEKKRRVLRDAAKEIENLFPRTNVDIDARAQGMIKHLKEFENKGKPVSYVGGGNKQKSNKAIALGIISGVLISSVLGFVIWKGRGRRSRRDRRTNDGIFIDTITRYLESNR